ncbi:hypothetical protein ILYODFUR_029334 [Ilyodon furcidens]|uniref:Uncharacterized protein n=1 Tax=Ilyodon furcidens TaxID=33524 RepID=A0ABV0TDD1_9TELE
MQLEEELTHRRAQVEDLQGQLRRVDASSQQEALGANIQPEALLLREQLLSAGREHHKESSELKEKHETALAASQQEISSLRTVVEKQSVEISKMKQKVQQANKENVEMMDSWKAKFDTLVSDHQRSLEELKASLSRGQSSPQGQEQDAQELRITMESLKMEHQLEMENLKAKHKIEAAILIKEREDLRARLQEATDQLAEGRSDMEAQSSKAALNEVCHKLQKAEARLAEMEMLQVEREKTMTELRESLELSEKTMTDYQAMQKAQAESQEEIQKLEEKLRVTVNQLQAVQADRFTPHDANMIEDNEISDEKMKLKQNIEGIYIHLFVSYHLRPLMYLLFLFPTPSSLQGF